MGGFQQTKSGIFVPSGDYQRERVQRMENAFLLYEHARAYAPGGSSHFSGKVAELNRALTSLNEHLQHRVKLFAAWHDQAQAILPSKVFGVVLWYVDEQGAGHIVGNPVTRRVEGGYSLGLGDNVMPILDFLASWKVLGETKNVHDFMNRYEDLMGISEKRRADEVKKKESRDEGTELVVEKVFDELNIPTRPDRTIPENSKGRRRKTSTD